MMMMMIMEMVMISPKSCEELEGRAQFEPQPSCEMGLCEKRQATPVDLVVTEHLAHVDHKGALWRNVDQLFG